MLSKSTTILAIAAIAEARFGQEQTPVSFITALSNFGNPGEAATLAGGVPGVLLAAANPCAKLELADKIVTTLGNDQQVIDGAKQLVAAEQNFNPFVVSIPNICSDASLPATAELRGIVPLIDPAVTGSDVENANSATSLQTPFGADGLSVADVMTAQGFSNFTAVANAGGAANAGGNAGNNNNNNNQNQNQNNGGNNANAGNANAGNNNAGNADAGNANAGNGTANAGNANAGKKAKCKGGKATAGKGKGKGNGNANAGNGNDNAGNNNAGNANAGNGTANAGTDNANAGNSNNNNNNNDGQGNANAGNGNANAGAGAAAGAGAVTDAVTGTFPGFQASSLGLDFGTCTPTIKFEESLNGRKAGEFTFQAQDPVVNKGQQEALNPNIITNRICDQLTNVCGAAADAKQACLDAKAQIQSLGTRDASTAEAWNSALGFAGVNINPDNAPQAGLVGHT